MRREGLEQWLRGEVEATSQSRVARMLGVSQSQVSRWARGAGELRGVLREAVEKYVEAQGIEVGSGEAASGDNPDAADGDGASATVDNTGALNGSVRDGMDDTEREGEDRTVSEGREIAENDKDALDASVEAASEKWEGQVVSGVIPDTTSRRADVPLSLSDRIEAAEQPEELAALAGAPVLAELPLEAARSGAQALARGWQWMRDSPPNGLHGDALFYLHTREEVAFADEGAKRVAFAPDTEMFECGLTGAELRYGIHPRQRQKRYAVERHEDRELLIGIRMAALVPEKPYPDERWFFGSSGSIRGGEWLAGAAEVISARRKMLAMTASFPEDISGKRIAPWQLALRNEQMRVELLMVNRHYKLTIGEHVDGDRTWAPSTRLGIETRWRNAEIASNEAEIRRQMRRRRRFGVLLWLPRLSARLARRFILTQRRDFGLFPLLHEHPMRRAAVAIRTGRVPKRWQVIVVRLLRELLYQDLKGQVWGRKEWEVDAPPFSEEYRRLWRPHEFDEGYRSDEGSVEPPPVNWRGRLMRKLRLTGKKAA